MEKYLELAGAFMNIRREYGYVRFDKEVSKKVKNDILIMSYLKRHGGIAHPKDLSEEFMISTARMAVILNNLEEKGAVIRLPDQEDNRQTIVQLTDEGDRLYEKYNGEILGFTARLFQEIGEEDSRELIRITRKMMDVVAERK